MRRLASNQERLPAMSEHPNNPQPQRRENPEPREASHPIPYLVLGVIAMLLAWALGYLMAARPDADPTVGDQRTLAALTGGPASSSASGPDAGQLYASHCQACHQRSDEHTSDLQSLMRLSYAVFCLKKKT